MIALGRSEHALVVIVPQHILASSHAVGSNELAIAVEHGHLGSPCVAGSLNLGNNAHTTLVGIAQQLHKLAAGKIAVGALREVVGIAVAVEYLSQVAILVESASAARSHLGKFGKAGNLESPCLVVGEMELVGVDLIIRQQVDKLFNAVVWDEVAGDVEHKAAVMEVGSIGHCRIGQFTPLRVVDGRDERLHTVEQTGLARTGDSDGTVVDHKAVGLVVVGVDLRVDLELYCGGLGTCAIDAPILKFALKISATERRGASKQSRLDGDRR